MDAKDIKTIFFVLSVLQGFISYGIAIKSIFKGEFKPQRMTWFLYFMMSFLMGFEIIVGGNTDAISVLVAQIFGSLVIFWLSIKKGVGGLEILDLFVLLSVVIILVVWYFTKNPYLALYVSIVADLAAFIPTLIKIYKRPDTENWLFYLSDVISAIFGLLALNAFTFDKLSFPLYIFIVNLAAAVMIVVRNNIKKKELIINKLV